MNDGIFCESLFLADKALAYSKKFSEDKMINKIAEIIWK